MSDDAELLRRYSEEDSEEAFAEFVRRNINLVYGAALRRTGGGPHRADDVTQQVFIAAARKARSLARHPGLTGWLYTATRNAAVNLMRDEHRRRIRESEAHATNELLAVPATVAEADWERLRPVLDAAMDELNENDREALLARFFEGRALAEVGQRLRVTENTARMRVERALEKLQARLAKRGVTSASAAVGLLLANEAGATAPVGLAASVTGAALSSAGSSSASAFLQFMSTTKFAVSAAAIIGLLALGIARYKVHAWHEAEASLAAARQDYAARVAHLRGLAQRMETTEQHLGELKQSVALAQAQVAADVEDAKPVKAWNPVEEGKSFLQRHPEVRQAMIESADANTRFRYEALYKSLALAPAQIEEFEAVVRGAVWGWSITATVTSDGRKAALSYDTLEQSEIDRRVRALLGEEGFTEYRKISGWYQTGLRLASQVAAKLCFTESPLTPQQADTFIQIVLAGLRPTGAPRPGVAFDQALSSVHTNVRPIFSSPQLFAWDAVSELSMRQAAIAKAKQSSLDSTLAK